MDTLLFLLIIFSVHLALVCFVAYQILHRKLSRPSTGTALAIILANITLASAYNYFFTYTTTFRGTYLPVLLTFFIFIVVLLMHQTVFKNDAKQLISTIPFAVIILLITGGITLLSAGIFRNGF